MQYRTLGQGLKVSAIGARRNNFALGAPIA